ncbi:uncharacterized protein LOC123014695 isoform X2 [Tribolium madens]|nr:uncharacterized protein LOC123014695 isoform X2 [Tribolium madens]
MLERLIPEEECEKVAVAGGIIRRTTVFPQLPEYHTIRRLNSLCIAFSEDIYCDSVFDASSVVINGNNLTSEDFEDHLLKFKSKIILRSNSLAFRICCSAKMRKNHESRVFNKVFPDTPLIGLEAEGEIGWNCFNHRDNNEEVENQAKKCKEGYPTVQHQWSTVIAFVTWGHLIHNTSRDL